MINILNQPNETQDAEQRLAMAYKHVFQSELGKLVFDDMLWNMYFLQPCETPEQTALSNYAKALLAKVYGGIDEDNVLPTIIERLFKKWRVKK